MAIYTTVFLAKPEDLLGGFPGWKAPLAHPVRREFRHPLTQEITSYETSEPEWNEHEEDLVPEYDVVAIDGSYEDYLEGRIPRFVRQQPYWAAKGLTTIELDPLIKAVGVEGEMTSPIYAPPSTGTMLSEFPADFIARLNAKDQDAVARTWAAEMSTPDHTHSVSGEKLYDGWTAIQALELLAPIAALARQAAPGQRMYVIIEA